MLKVPSPLKSIKAKSTFSLVTGERGLAMIEIIPIITVFVLMLNFSLGFFGVIHSGILSSIAARNYAFETFQFRSNLSNFRDTSPNNFTYYYYGYRYHATVSENNSSNIFLAAERPLKFSEIKGIDEPSGNVEEHSKTIKVVENKKASEVGVAEGVNPVWLKTIYGICLTATCGTEVRSMP
jgi:hypothetical protein